MESTICPHCHIDQDKYGGEIKCSICNTIFCIICNNPIHIHIYEMNVCINNKKHINNKILSKL
jgi:hypothetical protein